MKITKEIYKIKLENGQIIEGILLVDEYWDGQISEMYKAVLLPINENVCHLSDKYVIIDKWYEIDETVLKEQVDKS